LIEKLTRAALLPMTKKTFHRKDRKGCAKVAKKNYLAQFETHFVAGFKA